MNWHRYTGILSWFCIDMMTAVDSLQPPAIFFDEFAEFLATYGLQTAISITLSFPDIEMS